MDSAALFLLGNRDPEMNAIESLLSACGLSWGNIQCQGDVCHPAHVYKGDGADISVDDKASLAFVECGISGIEPIARIDHHHPGDPGYGLLPVDFMRAASLGQVIGWLALWGLLADIWPVTDQVSADKPPGHFFVYQGRMAVQCVDCSVFVPESHVLCAAADHCLGAAYAGQCPTVTPEQLQVWRVATRAQFQGRSESSIQADIETARSCLSEAPMTPGLSGVRDMRDAGHIPELPEAAARDNIPFIAEI